MTETKSITAPATGTGYDIEETVLYGEMVAYIVATGWWGDKGFVELEIPAQRGRRLAADVNDIRKLTAGI